jgi:signal transduction histidine kinase
VDNALLYREARQAVRARDDFLAIACHELRTPLTPLQARLAAAGRHLRRGDVLEPGYLEAAERQVRQLSRITKQMLDAALIQAGDIPLRQETVDLAAVVHDGLARFDPGPRHRFELRVTGPAPVHVDVTLIGEVLRGLLDNAVKFSPEGGTVTVVVSAREPSAILAVSDTGIGIPGPQLGAVFEGFFRASNAPVLSRGGFGLGLYVTRAIVERHGGRVRVESTEGRGSTFYVELPLAA